MMPDADAHTMAIRKWQKPRAVYKAQSPIDWKTILLSDVPERHARPIAWKFVKKGTLCELTS